MKMNAKRKLDERAELLFEMVDEAREREHAQKSEAELLEVARVEHERARHAREDLIKLGRERARVHAPDNASWYQLLERLYMDDQLNDEQFNRLTALWSRGALDQAREADFRDKVTKGMTKDEAQRRGRFREWLEVIRWDDRDDYDAEVLIERVCRHPALTESELHTLREFFAYRTPYRRLIDVESFQHLGTVARFCSKHGFSLTAGLTHLRTDNGRWVRELAERFQETHASDHAKFEEVLAAALKHRILDADTASTMEAV